MTHAIKTGTRWIERATGALWFCRGVRRGDGFAYARMNRSGEDLSLAFATPAVRASVSVRSCVGEDAVDVMESMPTPLTMFDAIFRPATQEESDASPPDGWEMLCNRIDRKEDEL
jgi:hypothetical protein